MAFPVTFDIDRPPFFQRAHVFLRVGLLVVIGWLGHPAFGLLWLGLPVAAAILLSQKGAQRYLDEDGPTITRVLGWIVAVVAYLALLTDTRRRALPGRAPGDFCSDLSGWEASCWPTSSLVGRYPPFSLSRRAC